MKNTSLISFNKIFYQRTELENKEPLYVLKKDGFVQWFNTYGDIEDELLKDVVKHNNLDDFLIRLLLDEYTNKVIELDDVLFVSLEVFNLKENSYDIKKMAFILNSDFIWSMQENIGDYFEWIRQRLASNKGLTRQKKADYLFFLILDSIVDNYEKTFEKISDYNDKLFSDSKIKPTPEFTSIIEDRKQELFKFKKATKSLRDTITKLEKVQLSTFETKYFADLKEQINNLLGDIDFELAELESKINLVFSIQGHHLNEVMKTLTIFSIIFTPITFLAGIYGMNFEYIPELKSKYGYFILLGVMGLITSGLLYYLRRKKWF